MSSVTKPFPALYIESKPKTNNKNNITVLENCENYYTEINEEHSFDIFPNPKKIKVL
jgi:hypothetical protein